jgi:mRNA interferase MazF
MEENFDNWNLLKKKLNERTSIVYANTREIWWCSFGLNIGTELYGKNELFERPVLILKVFNTETLKVVPLTTKNNSIHYQYKVQLGEVISYASLNQVKTISTKRLSRKVGRIDNEQFQLIIEKYKSLL